MPRKGLLGGVHASSQPLCLKLPVLYRVVCVHSGLSVWSLAFRRPGLLFFVFGWGGPGRWNEQSRRETLALTAKSCRTALQSATTVKIAGVCRPSQRLGPMPMLGPWPQRDPQRVANTRGSRDPPQSTVLLSSAPLIAPWLTMPRRRQWFVTPPSCQVGGDPIWHVARAGALCKYYKRKLQPVQAAGGSPGRQRREGAGSAERGMLEGGAVKQVGPTAGPGRSPLPRLLRPPAPPGQQARPPTSAPTARPLLLFHLYTQNSEVKVKNVLSEALCQRPATRRTEEEKGAAPPPPGPGQRPLPPISRHQ